MRYFLKDFIWLCLISSYGCLNDVVVYIIDILTIEIHLYFDLFCQTLLYDWAVLLNWGAIA